MGCQISKQPNKQQEQQEQHSLTKSSNSEKDQPHQTEKTSNIRRRITRQKQQEQTYQHPKNNDSNFAPQRSKSLILEKEHKEIYTLSESSKKFQKRRILTREECNLRRVSRFGSQRQLNKVFQQEMSLDDTLNVRENTVYTEPTAKVSIYEKLGNLNKKQNPEDLRENEGEEWLAQPVQQLTKQSLKHQQNNKQQCQYLHDKKQIPNIK